jgi:hypothetical protein
MVTPVNLVSERYAVREELAGAAMIGMQEGGLTEESQ